jgi:hypothetical protein
LLAALTIGEPIGAVPINRLHAVYKKLRADLYYLFSNKKINDPEQKKRIMIEIAGGIAIMFITGAVLWFWWIRPLQQQLHAQSNNTQEDEILQNNPEINSSSSLQHIFLHGNETFLCNLINQSSDKDLAQVDKYTSGILHYAASRNSTTVIKKLLDRKLDVNKQNNLGETPLHFAALSNQKEVVEFLLEQGANPTIANTDTKIPRELTTNKAIQDILHQAEEKWTNGKTG